MIKAYIFGASRVFLANNTNWLSLNSVIEGRNILDWTISGLEKSGIGKNNIHFVGGYEIDKVIAKYPDIQYVVNPKWQSTHVIGSLKYALQNWTGGDILLMYADTIYRTRVFQEIINETEGLAIGIDNQWKKRISDIHEQKRAEKIAVKDGVITQIGRTEIELSEECAQFSGLTFVKEHVVRRILRILEDKTALGSEFMQCHGSLSNLVSYLHTVCKEKVVVYNHGGNWAEIDSEYDLARFIFGTKAETLERIKPLLKKSLVTEQLHFTVDDWENNRVHYVRQIAKKFHNDKIIIRSSSFMEDSWQTSAAGSFTSVLNVDPLFFDEVESAIDEVVKSYLKHDVTSNFKDNQILVQPFISNVTLSGVAFTQHIERGSPYFVITYDDVSQQTNTVTSGNSGSIKTITIYKGASTKSLPIVLQQVIDALKELTNIVAYAAIDVEFVMDNNKNLFIVQVRPIVGGNAIEDEADFKSMLESAKKTINEKLKPRHHLFGETSILADMPDWNPAEMIGVRPNPLAISLYKCLITDSVWRKARSMIGYNTPGYEQLMIIIGGHPYIDVRNSFNNLIPTGLSAANANKLVNHYINRLKNNRHLHDKIEFEIAITCYTPDIDLHCQRLIESGFTGNEIDELKTKLNILTEQIITEKNHTILNLINRTKNLLLNRTNLLGQPVSAAEIPNIIGLLLEDTMENGTIPFSILARYAFVATSMLNGLVAVGAITGQQKQQFLNSIITVAGNLVDDMNQVKSNHLSLTKFLEIYGHLRPGTYDINSYSYSEKPEYYFENHLFCVDEGTRGVLPQPHIGYEFDKKTLDRIDQEIAKMNMHFSADVLLKFVRSSIEAREYAKFQFTKNLNAILQLLVKWGELHKIERADMGFLWVDDILKLRGIAGSILQESFLTEKIQEGKKWYKKALLMETPSFISMPEDIEIIRHNQSEPNFVTDKQITSEIVSIDSISNPNELAGKIVLIEGADPGYDWIFIHNIKGLVTKYGGVGSHMTIRCAEFGLPAAIGCGNSWYKLLKNARTVELNCRNKQINILS